VSPLTLECRQLTTGVLIIIVGEVDAANADHVESHLERVRQPSQPVVLDLGKLTFMDSMGLQVLLRLHANVRQQGTDLHLAAVSDIPARVLQITGLWDAFNIHPSVAQAIAVVNDHADRLREPS
jgi:anti-anti-sigma factor